MTSECHDSNCPYHSCHDPVDRASISSADTECHFTRIKYFVKKLKKVLT